MTQQIQTATSKQIPTYYIPDWNEYFESGKSVTYNNKSQCYMPCKQGLGLRRILRHKDGAALYGAWCAIIHLLSRQHKPRNGYLTHDGDEEGKPLTAEDISIATDIAEKYIKELIIVCVSDAVSWIRSTTVLLPDSYHTPTIVNQNAVCEGKGEGEGKGRCEGKGEGETDFDIFWKAYPKKKSKKIAKRAFVKAKEKPPIDKLLKIVAEHAASDDWKKDNGDFIPYPASWLNGGCWDDILKITTQPTETADEDPNGWL